MRLRNLDLNLLVTLDVLLNERSVTRAAEQLHLSQSAVSGALARLREHFRDELLVPVGRQMRVTPRGEELARDVRDILLQIESRVEQRPEFSPERLSRRILITASEYMIVVALAPLISRVQKAAPGVNFDIFTAYESPSEQLNRGATDFLIIPKVYASSEHPSEVLFEEEFCCVVWEGNKQVKKSIDLRQYSAMEHIVVEVGHARKPSYEQRFIDRFAPERKVTVQAPSHVVAPWLVLGTNRIATLHRRLAERFAEFLPLRILPVPVDIPPLVEVIQWHQYRSTDEGLMWIKQQLKHGMSRLGAPTSSARHPSAKVKVRRQKR